MSQFARMFFFVLLGLQAIAAVGFARGAALCVHPDGEKRVETRFEQANCHSQQNAQSTDTTSLTSRKCTDVPVNEGSVVGHSNNPSAYQQVDAVFDLALVPAFIPVLSAGSGSPSQLDDVDDQRIVSACASLRTVVLVI